MIRSRASGERRRNQDNDPTQDYYLSRLILGSIRDCFFAVILLWINQCFVPFQCRGTNNLGNGVFVIDCQGYLFQFCKLLGSPEPRIIAAQILVLHSQARFCLVRRRRKLQSLLLDHCGLCCCCRPIISFGLGNVLCCQNYQGDYDFSNRRLQLATSRYKVFQNNKRHHL